MAVSDGVAESISSHLGLPEDRIVRIYNPVVSDRLHSQSVKFPDHPWFSSSGPPIVLAAGRLKPQKDIPSLIRAFSIIQRERPLRLIILGEGEEREDLEQMTRSLGIEDRVSLPGWVPNPYSYMSRSALFVHSSRYEGLGNVLIEALACGCPCVSTNCPSGPSEILSNGRVGPLVPVGDVEALARAMKATLDSPPPRELLMDQASRFSVDNSISGYDTLIRAVTDHRHVALGASIPG